jgi:RNA polymerase primary sigma factor
MGTSRNAHNALLARYFHEIRSYPRLTREREVELAHHVEKGCESCRNQLVESNLSFVVKVASEYRNLGMPLEDLLNEGNLGLIEAASRFDASKGTKFITYAIWWIRKSILRALSERSTLVRVPGYQMKRVREIRDAESSLRRQLGRKPDREEISSRLRSDVSKIDQVLQFNMREVSLEHRVGREKDQTIQDYLPDERSPNAEDDMIQREDSCLVTEAVHELTEQEKSVVRYRYGLSGDRARTLKEVGELMNISRERVRQIEVKAKGRLRKIFDERRSIKSPDKGPVFVQPEATRRRDH